MNEIQATKRKIADQLSSYYPQEEAEQLARLLLEEAYALSYPNLVISNSKVNEKISLLREWVNRLLHHEPIQYIFGHTSFMGFSIKVEPGVLIPRPETEMMCHMLQSRGYLFPGAVVADICTGSGAIALFMATRGAIVEAVDISSESIKVAHDNFALHNVNVELRKADIFAESYSPVFNRYDCVVSNPPYVLQSERDGIMPHVLEYEPELALFVPNDDPLIFYRRIRDLYAGSKVLVFEINPLCMEGLRSLFGDREVEYIEDYNHKIRYLVVN